MRSKLVERKAVLLALLPKISVRLFLGIVFILAWNKFVKGGASFRMLEKNMFFLGVVLFVMAWFNYLKIDGMGMSSKNDEGGHRANKKGILNYLEEEIKDRDSGDRGDSENLILTAAANVITAFVFLFPAVIMGYL